MPAKGDARSGGGDAIGRHVLVQMDPSFIRQSCGVAALALGQARAVRSPKIAAAAASLLRAKNDGDGATPLVLATLWTAMARAVGRRFGGVPPRPGDAWLNPEALRRVVEHAERGQAAGPPLDELAKTAGLSPSAFARAFRGATGDTPYAFILKLRLSRAEALMRDTGLPIAMIAQRTGFGSAAHLSAAYRASRGRSPSSYREEANEAKQVRCSRK